MPVLGKYTQQPSEFISYAVDFGPWVTDRNDSVASYTATADAGLTISHSRTDNVITVVASGGVNGTRYKVTVLATTAAALKKEAEFWVRIKEV